MAATVGWWSAKAVAISNHRQNWINALRDDLANYLTGIDVLRFRVTMLNGDHYETTIDDLEKQQEARNTVMVIYRRILLRLNMLEKAHMDLAALLNQQMMIGADPPNQQQAEQVVSLAQRILKDEWNVAKYGIFTRPILAIKRCVA
jgi:hypothetical protein